MDDQMVELTDDQLERIRRRPPLKALEESEGGTSVPPHILEQRAIEMALGDADAGHPPEPA